MSHRPIAVVSAIAAVLVCAAPAAATRGCANAGTPVAGASRASIKLAVVCLVDHERSRHGLPPLQANALLDRSAQGWTQAMVANDFFSHGTNFSARITQAGFRWSQAGENIASGFETPTQVVAAWMASTGHCQNILDPNFSQIGVGVVSRPVAGAASGAATWTTDFALPFGAPLPSRNLAPMRGCPYTS
jgi:uncharacterized protein YkwD